MFKYNYIESAKTVCQNKFVIVADLINGTSTTVCRWWVKLSKLPKRLGG